MSKRKDMVKRIAAGVLAVLLVVEGAGSMIFASEDEADNSITVQAELPLQQPEGTEDESGLFSEEVFIPEENESVTEVESIESQAEEQEASSEVTEEQDEAEESREELIEEAPNEETPVEEESIEETPVEEEAIEEESIEEVPAEEEPAEEESIEEESIEEEPAEEKMSEEPEAPVFVGSVDAELVGQLKNAGSITISNSGYCEYAAGQQSYYNGVTVGAGTRYYKAGGNTAYCVEPEYPGSANAQTLTAYEIEDSSLGGYGEEIRKVMYRTYGAPGWTEDDRCYAKMQEALAYEAANTSYKDENQMGYVYGHLMMSKVFSDIKGNLNYSGDISNWNIGLYGTYAHMAGYTTDLVYVALRAAAAPSCFHVYLVPSTAARNQSFMYWTYEPEGYLYVHKYIDSNESVLSVVVKTYDLGGTKYRAFKDEACTEPVGDIMTVPSGRYDTNTIALPLGIYWIKEVEGPTQGWYSVNPDPLKVALTEKHISEPCKVYSGEKPYFAKLKICKSSSRSIPNTVQNKKKYYRNGAVYDIYYDPDGDGESSDLVKSVTTVTVDGVTEQFALPIGHYYAIEVQGPANGTYALNKEPVPFDVKPEMCAENPAVAEDYLTVIRTADDPIFGGLRIKKVPDEISVEFTYNNPCYQLEGAEFSVYKDSSLSENSFIGTLTTDENGETDVLGDLGEGTYYLVETKTSPGFGTAPDFTKNNPRAVTITADKLDEVRVVTCREPAADDPVSLRIVKEDAEGEAVASLAGAQFEVRYYKGYYDAASLPEEPERVWTLETKQDTKNGGFAASLDPAYLAGDAENDPLYYNSDGKPTIPLGTAAVVETKAPAGYTFEEGKVLSVIRIDEAFLKSGGQGESNVKTAVVTVSDKRTRYGLKFTKTDRDGNPLANIPFLLSSAATGEQHVLMTGKDGVLSTETRRHSVRTNASDAAYTGGKLDESKLEPEAGVWFSGSSADTAADDGRGALLYGEYTITELRSSANEGFALINPITVRISGDVADGGIIDLGTIIDDNKNIITSVTSSKTNTQIALAEKNAVFLDKVMLSGYNGECMVRTSIYNAGTGGQLTFADGTKEISTTVNADGGDTTVTIPFTFDASKMAGSEAAVVTTVLHDGETVTHNADFKVEAEKIYFPSVCTSAAAENGTQYAALKKAAAITDTVTWSCMPKGTALTTKTRVFVRGDKAADDREIKEAAVTNTYTAGSETGSKDVTVTVDTDQYAGRVIYITEEDYISVGGKEILIASETDRDAIDQYIYIPKLVTTAVNAETGKKNIPAAGEVSILDTVEYSGFRAGEKLSTVTEAWAKGDREEDDAIITVKKGTLETKAAQGSYEVVLTFDASKYAGREIYIVEKNYIGSLLVSQEGGRDNEKQTVTTVTIGTTLKDTKTGSHRALAEEEVTLKDTIACSGLTKGEKYMIFTLLMDENGFAFRTDGTVSDLKAAEIITTDEQELKDKGLIYRKTEETAKDTEGTFTVDMVFDGRALSGRKAVASESIFEAGSRSLVAVHSDPSDEEQTVEFPKIGTTLADTETKTHISLADEEVVNVDSVSYRGLAAGKTYPLIGILMNEEGYAWKKDGTLYEKEKAEELIRYKAGIADLIFEKTPEEKVDAVAENLEKLGLIWSRSEFTAEAEEGRTEITFTYDGRPLAGQKVVAGETVYGDGEVLAVHFVPEDKEQTVCLPKMITKAADGADGTKQVSELDGENAVIKDTVYYEGMLPGTEVVTFAKLFRKGETAEEDELLVQVKTDPVTIQDENGSYTVDIPFDAAGLGGEKLYVTEENFIFIKEGESGEEGAAEVRISGHIDREDADQTVTIPQIGTTLTDSASGAHIAFADSDVTNYDHVAYENLEAGKNYPIITIYMDGDGAVYRKDGTAGSGTPMDYYRKADIAGTPEEKIEAVRAALKADNILFAEGEFTAEAESGETVVEIHYEGLPFAGKKATAAEGVFEEGRLLAAHIVPEDEDQSMYFPKIVTRAANGADGGSYVKESRNAVITDTLYYEMYPAGSRVKTVLVLCNADTGEELMKDGKVLTTEKTYYPEGSGEEIITFSFDSTGLGSTRIGLRETNYVMNGDVWVPCASDSFLENEKQILTHIPKPNEPTPTPSIATPTPSIAAPTPSTAAPSAAAPAPGRSQPGKPVKTGDVSMPFVWFLLLFVGAAVLKNAVRPRKK